MKRDEIKKLARELKSVGFRSLTDRIVTAKNNSNVPNLWHPQFLAARYNALSCWPCSSDKVYRFSIEYRSILPNSRTLK